MIRKFETGMHESLLYNPSAKYNVIYSLLISLALIPEFLPSFHFSIDVVVIPI